MRCSDIKLDNFIYENEAEDAELKLIDFGFAAEVFVCRPDQPLFAARSMTTPGGVVRTRRCEGRRRTEGRSSVEREQFFDSCMACVSVCSRHTLRMPPPSGARGQGGDVGPAGNAIVHGARTLVRVGQGVRLFSRHVGTRSGHLHAALRQAAFPPSGPQGEGPDDQTRSACLQRSGKPLPRSTRIVRADSPRLCARVEVSLLKLLRCSQEWDRVTDEAKDFCRKLMQKSPRVSPS